MAGRFRRANARSLLTNLRDGVGRSRSRTTSCWPRASTRRSWRADYVPAKACSTMWSGSTRVLRPVGRRPRPTHPHLPRVLLGGARAQGTPVAPRRDDGFTRGSQHLSPVQPDTMAAADPAHAPRSRSQQERSPPRASPTSSICAVRRSRCRPRARRRWSPLPSRVRACHVSERHGARRRRAVSVPQIGGYFFQEAGTGS